MSRSLKKGPYVDERILKKISAIPKGDKTAIKIWNRAAVITPEMVGYTFGIHNGKDHIKVMIVEEMVGHRLGEFAPTRKFIKHGGRMAREEQAQLRATEAGKTQTPEGEEEPAKTEASTEV
ncbi:MAG: 30S ribosomal protein S19 [Candidatus Berkelbacteria bacterium]|nr:30S ribosomal protein S19 [Candidatus Berkelbacteria bacterium]